MATYQWRAYTNYNAEDYTCDGQPLDHGVIPNDGTSWKTATLGGATETHNYKYYYRDASSYCYPGATCFCNETSIRVIFDVTETWTSSYNPVTNKITLTVSTVINSIDRDDAQGTQSATYGRYIEIYRGGDNTLVATFNESASDVITPHNISGTIDLGTQSITIDPGDLENGVSTIHIHNSVPGSTSWDDIRAGTQFRNTLPLPTTYTLNYNANGGSGAPATQTGSTGAGSYTFTLSSSTPTHAWWDFLGWADSASATSPQYSAGGTITLQESSPTKTIYAVWDKTYRPGDTYNNNAWWSHDRSAGAANIFNGSSWQTMRTKDGNGSTTGDPPYIRSSSDWVNMRRIGSE